MVEGAVEPFCAVHDAWGGPVECNACTAWLDPRTFFRGAAQ